jgi:hypothetical protein
VDRYLIPIRSLFAIALSLIFSVMLVKPGFANENWETIVQISDPTGTVTIQEDQVAAKNRSWFSRDLPVTLDELAFASATVATAFVAAAGSIALFVPAESQMAALTVLILIAATPVDGLIIGGGAIAAYRYFRRDELAEAIEVFSPSWIDRWTYNPN